MSFIRKLTRRSVHVKPLDASLFAGTSIILHLTIWGNFADDWRRYGWRVAVCNFWCMLRS